MTGIISIIYKEPEWKQTKRFIQQLDLPTVYVDRKGVGSMAKAYNRGFDKLIELHPNLDYVWMVSNIVPYPDTIYKLSDSMDAYPWAWDAISPCFQSDHDWIRPQFYDGVKAVPFIEFTAPMVRVKTFKQFPLDEQMPYWGHDLDWGYRVRQAGGKIGVHYSAPIQHEYIRHKVKRMPLPITKERRRLRKETDESTRQRLVELYGENWGKVLGSKIH